MNAVGFLFAFICSVLLFAVPRRWALLPFLMGVLYMGCFFQMEICPLHFIASRVLMRQFEDLVLVCKMICVLLIPLGAAMMFEKLTGKNFFEFLGGAPGMAELRNGHFRARGPFIHQIFAGTVGAVCMPMALVLWRQERKLALAGLAASAIIVVASGSS